MTDTDVTLLPNNNNMDLVRSNALPWENIADEAERLIAFGKGSRNAAKEGHNGGEQENGQEMERDETARERVVYWYSIQ